MNTSCFTSGKLYIILTIMITIASLLSLAIMVLFYFHRVNAITKDYCADELCGGEGRHIACNNDGSISPQCASNSEIVDLSLLKNDIVNAHNSYRNQIAGGKIKGYQPAKRMATMTWDDELAYLAALNVKTCEFKHDECRNTDEYRHSGQNLGYWSGYPAIEPKNAILNAIKDWFMEYQNTDMKQINKFQRPSASKKPYGHFTVMVADKNIKVGCGLLKKQDEIKSPKSGNKLMKTTYLFACNYATTNIIDRPIYKSGKTASECTTGINPKYPFLCSTKESYNLDPLSN